MPTLDLIAGQHLQGAAIYNLTHTYGGGQYVFNTTTNGVLDGVGLTEIMMLLTGLPAPVAAAKINNLTFSGSVTINSGSAGEVGEDLLANSQLYEMYGGLGGFGGFTPDAAGQYVALTGRLADGVASSFSDFVVNTDNIDVSYDELTALTGFAETGVFKIGFPTTGFVFGSGFDVTLTLTSATLDYESGEAPQFWTGFNITRETAL